MREIKKKRVLSIDMDYIMAPCIQLYNDLVNGYQAADDVWSFIEKARNIDAFLDYDKNKLAFIFDIFTVAIMHTDKDKIMFARNHDSILDLLCTEENKDYVYDVVNIDHHHDIFYSEQGKQEIERFSYTSLSNWIWYLNSLNRLVTYTWVKNNTSANFEAPNEDFVLDFIFNEITEITNNELFEQKYDYVFVCCSPEWTPPKFAHFISIMKQIASNLKEQEYEIINGKYCKDGKSRPYEAIELG